MPSPDRLPSSDADLVVLGRFCGPTGSGNGGYTAGLLAERILRDATRPDDCPVVEVTLLRPPPLDVAMTVRQVSGEGRGATLEHDGIRVAEARCSDAEIEPVEAVTPGTATEAGQHYAGFRSHPFPHCFACGTDREAGDGLRIFPGPVGGAGSGRVAALWVPASGLAESSDLLDEGVERVGPATAWAALDCVGGWSTDLEGRPMVLGRITAQVDALPVVGEPHVVTGADRGSEGRKTFTASTLYDSDGRIVGRAQHTWIAVDPSTFV